MSNVERFAAYAAAFEKAYDTDDWSVVAPFFAEDAVYEVPLEPPVGGRFEGRDAILAYFKTVLDGFDRRFESRELAVLEGPVEHEDGSVWLRGSARYRAEGVPELVLELEEIAHFDGEGRIRRLEDRYSEAMKAGARAYLEAHGAKLGIPPSL